MRHNFENIVEYLLACVEADYEDLLQKPAQGDGFVVLSSGENPFITRISVEDSSEVAEFMVRRSSGKGGEIHCGFPLVTGWVEFDGVQSMRAAPLLIAEVVVAHDSGFLTISTDISTLAINPFAIDLLGVDRHERDAIVEVIENDPSFLASDRPADAVRAACEVVASMSGVRFDDEFIEGELGLLAGYEPRETGVHGACGFFVASSPSFMTHHLRSELATMGKSGQLLERGPLGALLGRALEPAEATVVVHPIILESSIQQDRALHSALTEDLTVVTGPPGTG